MLAEFDSALEHSGPEYPRPARHDHDQCWTVNDEKSKSKSQIVTLTLVVKNSSIDLTIDFRLFNSAELPADPSFPSCDTCCLTTNNHAFFQFPYLLPSIAEHSHGAVKSHRH